MPASETEGQPRSRKRSRASKSEDASQKKARGRPRVDPAKDASTADRRRTQIRLAQRAYRQRKETTISTLTQKNTQLQSIINQMNRTFLRFNDATIKSGLLQLNPTVAQELKEVTEAFVTLGRLASEGNDIGDDEEDDAGGPDLDPAFELHSAATVYRVQSQGTQQNSKDICDTEGLDIGWGHTATPLPPSKAFIDPTYQKPERLNSNSSPSGNCSSTNNKSTNLVRKKRQVTTGEVIDQSRFTQSIDQQQLPFGLLDVAHREPALFPATSLEPHCYSTNHPSDKTPPLLTDLAPKTLLSSFTYSHDETTFSRRLIRAALELGFRFLSTTNTKSTKMQYAFRLSLPYMSLDQLRERFRLILSRGTDEDLGLWDSPFIHLGGAGTHYPRKNRTKTVRESNKWTFRQIGSASEKMLRVENTDDPSQSHNINVDLTGFEGEWFDADDVEGYLEEEKGCYIDPHESFAEVLIDDEDSSGDSQTSNFVYSRGDFSVDLSFSQPLSNHQQHGYDSSADSSSTEAGSLNSTINDGGRPSRDNSFSKSLATVSEGDPTTMYGQSLEFDLAPGYGTNFSVNRKPLSSYNFGDGLNLMVRHEPLSLVKQKRKKPALVDVSKLIEGIIKHGVCLGQAPAFRRRDVDVAFRAAIISVY